MTAIFGLIITAAILALSLEGKLSDYVQIHSFILVFGGTISILIFSTPVSVLKSLGRSLWDMVRGDDSVKDYQDQILKLAGNRFAEVPSEQPLITYAQELWAQGIDPDLFIVLLSQKRRELEAKANDGIHALKNLAKYPPTLGMTGTVMGMIALFSSLDANKGSIGTALSTAMTATFFGLILANGLISPMADRLHVRHVHHQRVLENLYELLLLINQGEPVFLIREELNERAG